ncbi:unnamed protein product [Arabidopsis halleri]
MSGPSNKQNSHPCDQEKLTLTVPQDIYNSDNKISDKVMSLIVQSKPDGEIVLFDDAEEMSFVCWRKTSVSEFPKEFTWKDKMGPVRDEGKHDICWALVTTPLYDKLSGKGN